MTLEECYAACNGDYLSARSRLMGEALVSRFLLMFLDDTSYRTLLEGMEKKDVDMAFLGAHTLKGVCQNLSLRGLYGTTYQITEALRSKDMESAKLLLPDVQSAYEDTIGAIQSYKKYIEVDG